MLKAHSLSPEEILRILKTDRRGLSEEEAKKRLKIYGKNEIEEEEESLIKVFFRQFNNPFVYILFVASGISAYIGKKEDSLIILAIIFVNSLLGFFQEFRAITSLKALKKLTEVKTKVYRDGKLKVIPASELVPGDVVYIQEGDVVPADIRLIESVGLMVDESVLTGESVPVEKNADVVLPEDTPVYNRSNVVFKGTHVVKGWAVGVVYATGRQTEFGKISEKAKEKSPETPLMRALKKFSLAWMVIIFFLLSILFLIGIYQGRDIYEVLLLIVSELVSAVPEGLPLVITFTLVIGAIALSRRKVLIRYLPATETLGSTTFICSDKTGTITEGKLKVQEFFALNEKFLNLISALCNSSDGESGDPVDLALLRWLEENDIDWKKLREEYRTVKVFPFDTKKRYMAVIVEKEGKYYLLVKGAFETLSNFSEGISEELIKVHDVLAENGLRVLFFAYAEIPEPVEDIESLKLKPAGFVGFLDPPKEGVKEAVVNARRAGIRVIMITGDNLKTAVAVAKQTEIYREGDLAVEGKDLSKYSDAELYNLLKRVSVIARALPEDKYRVVKVLQEKGEIVAVTGDGVNDVPALKVADIGVAMGSGTEAAKSVAKMVITDNNLKVIVEAVRWGRIIVRNIKRAITYLLTTSFGEITLLSSAILMKLPLPLYPTQILWINIVTDGVQDKTFPFNKEEIDVMKEKPQKPEKVFLDKRLFLRFLTGGLFIGFINLILFKHLLSVYSYEVAVTITFTSMVVNQWAVGIQTVRDYPFFYKPWRNFQMNPYIFIGIFIGLILQLLAIYVFPNYFHAVPLSLEHWFYVILTTLSVFIFIEIRKLVFTIFSER
ncbi:cation-translocating P-type ATPase [Aquifex aeolicus]|uniref:Cation transporting ATPase (E1-E2 family) n=1 Tax=Aquifex aeolicus (strain VF5) TaxID=224324 RepID=O66938_AQUAE|nr:cation-transporting P-type ATPase [Aquifex aeolicus]AAC06899.1 cation transporting ATPase (E1-E2 family) [Aquifex aeolicus VF5]